MKQPIQQQFFYTLFICVVLLCACDAEPKMKEAPENKVDKKENRFAALSKALTFYASYDSGVDADFALGDKTLYTRPKKKEADSIQVGLHKEGVMLSMDKGKFGGALKFNDKKRGYIYYPSENNIAYSKKDWNGTVSFWLSLDPNNDLKPGFCDPIQITDVSYNDAAIWVDFTKDNPRVFRLGVIGDRDAWNPKPKGPDNENPIFIRQLPPVRNPPFGSGQWTHIAITFSHLNTDNGEAKLYINGELKGKRSPIKDPFTWELEKSNIYLGLSYIGLMDELTIFNRSLSRKEINDLYKLENGGHDLIPETAKQ